MSTCSNAPYSLVVIGHVDHGKSTLVGRLLQATGSLPEGKLEQIQRACEAEGMPFEYAFILDALLEEQGQNVTIDTTQIEFRSLHSPHRCYVIIDAPGHEEFIKNMVTGAARAQAAILVIDAALGFESQTRRHLQLLPFLGIEQVILAVNKMDRVNYTQAAFEKIQAEASERFAPLGLRLQACIPVSAREGDNLTERSPRLAWHAGSSLMEALDALPEKKTSTDAALRFTVQDVYRFDERRLVAGRVESGRLAIGDELIFWPDRKRGTVAAFDSWNSPRNSNHAESGQSVAFTLAESIYVERGQIAATVEAPLIETRHFEAKIFWLGSAPLTVGAFYQFKLGTQTSEVQVTGITSVFDPETGEAAAPASQIKAHQIGEIKLRAQRPLAFDNYATHPSTGRFVLVEKNQIGGGGIIFNGTYPASIENAVTGDHLSWTQSAVTTDTRSRHFGHRGAILWFTGLSGSGKSTLAIALEARLLQRGIGAYILDGDNLRHGLCVDLDFSPEGRKENVRRAAETAKLLADAGLIVIVALISPYRQERDHARASAERAGITFAEIYINAPVTVCEARDPRKLYAKARAGEIKNFTGIDAPYEPPVNPALELRTDSQSKESCLEALFELTTSLTQSNPATP